MPPEGYDTITVPESLVQRLEELDGDSHTATLRMLIADHKTTDENDTVAVDAGSVDDIANQTAQKVVRELESTLR